MQSVVMGESPTPVEEDRMNKLTKDGGWVLLVLLLLLITMYWLYLNHFRPAQFFSEFRFKVAYRPN